MPISNILKGKTMLFRKSKINAVEKTLKLLAGYHAVKLDNEQFMRQYRHIFTMLAVLRKEI
jgi:hypothetical protein